MLKVIRLVAKITNTYYMFISKYTFTEVSLLGCLYATLATVKLVRIKGKSLEISFVSFNIFHVS